MDTALIPIARSRLTTACPDRRCVSRPCSATCGPGGTTFTTVHAVLVRSLVCLLVLIGASGLRAEEARLAKLFLIGGSTMATFPDTRPVVGWGQILPLHFKDPDRVDNRAKSGRSTKSFIDQGLWDQVLADLRAGDFLIMCWGTNDSASDPARRTEPRKDFQGNLERMVRECRAKGATPIIATSVARRVWTEQGDFVEPSSEYVVVSREVAAREDVPLMELRGLTVELERSLGVEGSRGLHLYLEPGQYESYPNGSKDDTHYNRHGATRVSELAVQEIRRLKLPLMDWLK
jgi:lysophospholipase L1-like esterase